MTGAHALNPLDDTANKVRGERVADLEADVKALQIQVLEEVILAA